MRQHWLGVVCKPCFTPPMMPDPTSWALVSLASLLPWKDSLKWLRTASVNPWRDAQLVIWRMAIAVPPG